MKIMFISDIHGVDSTLEQVLNIAKEINPTKIAILGDVLYHGPRNGVPEFYNPQRVAELLNANKNQLISVRGNCDTEVDQMMLSFPVLARSAHIMLEDGATFFLTHGHIWGESNFEKIFDGNAILVHGHTHLPVNKLSEKGFRVFNPGSISLPKGGNPKTYMIYENRRFSIYDVDGNVITSVAR